MKTLPVLRPFFATHALMADSTDCSLVPNLLSRLKTGLKAGVKSSLTDEVKLNLA